jgi:hypothetical protein
VSVVYDLVACEVHFVTSANRTRRTILLPELNFNPSGRTALAWHGNVDGESWVANMDATNEALLNHYAAYGGNEAFAQYVQELRQYRAAP